MRRTITKTGCYIKRQIPSLWHTHTSVRHCCNAVVKQTHTHTHLHNGICLNPHRPPILTLTHGVDPHQQPQETCLSFLLFSLFILLICHLPLSLSLSTLSLSPPFSLSPSLSSPLSLFLAGFFSVTIIRCFLEREREREKGGER